MNFKTMTNLSYCQYQYLGYKFLLQLVKFVIPWTNLLFWNKFENVKFIIFQVLKSEYLGEASKLLPVKMFQYKLC